MAYYKDLKLVTNKRKVKTMNKNQLKVVNRAMELGVAASAWMVEAQQQPGGSLTPLIDCKVVDGGEDFVTREDFVTLAWQTAGGKRLKVVVTRHGKKDYSYELELSHGESILEGEVLQKVGMKVHFSRYLMALVS